MPPRALRSTASVFVVLSLAACGTGSTPPDDDPPMMPQGPSFAAAAADARSPSTDPTTFFMDVMARANAALAAQGAEYRVAMVEWLGADQAGQTLFFFDVGNKQVGADFVPGDPRPPRGGRTNITYTIDQAEGAVDALTQAQTNAAIGRALQTWDDETCSTIPIVSVPNPGGDIGIVEFLGMPPVGPGRGGSPVPFADIVHAGWLPGGTFPAGVIAVTFTAVFLTTGGQPTDIDHDGQLDVALREILYHDAFTWRVNGNVDVETVALHESGHGLSQGHFGQAFATLANNRIHFAPRAVMNAAYSGIQHDLTATDNAGHCSLWASWPSN